MHVLLSCAVCPHDTIATNDCYHAPCRCKDFNLNTTHPAADGPEKGSGLLQFVLYSTFDETKRLHVVSLDRRLDCMTNGRFKRNVYNIRFDDNRVFNELGPLGSRRARGKRAFVYVCALAAAPSTFLPFTIFSRGKPIRRQIFIFQRHLLYGII